MTEIPNEHRGKLLKLGSVFLIVLTAYFAVRILGELRSMDHMEGVSGPSITLSGHGEVQAVPDIATVYFTIESSKSTQGAASDDVNTKTKAVLAFVKSSGVADKDVKTENYSSYPKYSTPQPCVYSDPQYGYGMMPPCPASTGSKIIGYNVSESVTVKIRKADDASKIIDGINKIGVTNMSGPNFTIDNEDDLKAQARKKAIDDAKAKAEALAKDLGVHLGKVQSFSESGNYPGPIYYAKTMSADSGTEATPPQLPKGENTISSDVSITYEIR